MKRLWLAVALLALVTMAGFGLLLLWLVVAGGWLLLGGSASAQAIVSPVSTDGGPAA